jgi:antitoxin (DNA-binding transcriptional repressor) of toxin-antitoxin stability system
MRIVNIREAKTHLWRLIERAAKGEPFVIAKADKPMVKVIPFDAPAQEAAYRLHERPDRGADDFDLMNREEIERLFGSTE